MQNINNSECSTADSSTVSTSPCPRLREERAEITSELTAGEESWEALIFRHGMVTVHQGMEAVVTCRRHVMVQVRHEARPPLPEAAEEKLLSFEDWLMVC